MAPLRFENLFTIGNVITIIGAAIGMVWSYAELSAEQRLMSAQISVLEATVRDRVAAIETSIRERGLNADQDQTAKDARIRALETQASGVAADVRNIQAGIGRIENAVEQLSQKVKP